MAPDVPVLDVWFLHSYYPSVAAVVEAINKSLASIEGYSDIQLALDGVRRKVFIKTTRSDIEFICKGKISPILHVPILIEGSIHSTYISIQ